MPRIEGSAERRATQLAQAEERAAVAERKQAEAEAKLAASQACGRVSLSLQVHPQLRHGGMTHARTQTPRLMSDQMSVGTQAPSRLEAAAEAPQQQHQQRQQRQQLHELKERAEERARNDLLPVYSNVLSPLRKQRRGQHQRGRQMRTGCFIRCG